MYVNKLLRSWSSLVIYAACLIVCGAVLVLGVVAFSISTDLVVSASAQIETQRNARFPVLAALPAVDDNVQLLFPSSKRPLAALSRSRAPVVAPVVISRVQDEGAVAAAVPVALEDAASPDTPDTDEWATFVPWTPDRSDTFRTVCVRLCDGAYFPISFATTRDRFKADAAKCKSTCGSPARLFVGPPHGAAEDLVDVRGSAYSDLANAFKYRTSYDAACTCKAQPWETAEIERHRQLAEVSRQNAQVTVKLADRSVALPRSEAQVEMAAIQPQQSPRNGKIDSGRNTDRKAVASAAAEPSVRRAAARSPAGKAPKSNATVKKRVVQEVRVAATSLQPREVGRPPIGYKDSPSMQRPFRAKEYWRLSYWDPPGF